MNVYDLIKGAFGVPGQPPAAGAVGTAQAAAAGAFGVPGSLTAFASPSVAVPPPGERASIPQEDAQVQRLAPPPAWRRWILLAALAVAALLAFRFLRRKG